MPSSSVKLIPGVNTIKTPALNEAGISSSNLIRFREGLIEKRGGWSSYYSGLVGIVARAIWPWRDFLNQTFVAIGLTNKLVVLNGGVLTDITPLVLVSNLTNCYTGYNSESSPPVSIVEITDASYSPKTGETIYIEDISSMAGVSISGYYNVTNLDSTHYYFVVRGYVYTGSPSNVANVPTYATTTGSSTVTVTLTAHGLTSAANTITPFKYAITNAVSVGGLTLVGPQTVASVIDANTFTIQIDKVATSTASVVANGGKITVVYSPTPTYGQTVVGTEITATDWSIANYGQLLVACPVGGSIYEWQTTGANITATVIPNSPQASGILVSDAAQQIIAYGGNPNTLFDPNYVAWCDTGNPTTWLAAVGNQAGSYRIPTGSAVVGAASVASSLILLWTDVDVYVMQYIGYPIVYGFTKLAVGCGLIAQFAWAKLGTSTFWMSQKRFWAYDGASVTPLDCPIYDNVFPLLSQANLWKIRGATNSQFNEVTWFFPSTSGTGENDMYVCFNPIEGTWDYGAMPRSCWADQSIAGAPLAVDPLGNVYQHETSQDAAGSAMPWSFTTGLFELSEGEDFSFVDWIRPDFKFPSGVGTIQVSVLVYKFASDTPIVKGPYPFTVATEFINTRCRGRYIALKFSGSDTGSFWRIGRTQFRYAPSGRR